MALAVIARFADVYEGRVARSALQAAKFDAYLLGEDWATIYWTEQLAIGGVRLGVPDGQAEAASEFLRQVQAEAPRLTPRWSPEPFTLKSLAAAPWLIACAVVGWPLAAFRKPGRFHKIVAAILAALAFAMLILVFIRR